MIAIRRWLVLATFLLATTGAPTAQEKPEEGVREEITVVLVKLNLIATDRHGRPVTDLTPEEMVVKAGGKNVRIAYLEPVAPRDLEAGLAPVKLYVDAPGGWSQPLESKSGDAHFVLFFVDAENDYKLRKNESLEKAIAYVRNELDPGAVAAVMSFDGAVELVVPFTSDREALTSALASAWHRTAKASIDLEGRIRFLMNRMEDCVTSGGEFARTGDTLCIQDVTREYMEESRPRAERFLAGLGDTIDFLSGLSGRKTVVVLSHGVPVDPLPVITEVARAVFGNTDPVDLVRAYAGFGGTAANEMDRIIRRAVDHRVTVHFIDRMPAPTSDFGAKKGQTFQPGASPATAAYRAAQSDLEEIAVNTGGLFVAETDVSTGLRRIGDARRGAYELGYYLEDWMTEKQLRKVSVDTTRKGVRLSHRRGFASGTPESAPGMIGRILVAPPTKNGAESRRQFRIEADPGQIGYRIEKSEAVADFTLNVSVQDEKGRERVGAYHLLNHAYRLDLWTAEDIEPVTIGGWVDLPPGTYTLRATLRNTQTGWTGELATTITQPGPSPIAPNPSE